MMVTIYSGHLPRSEAHAEMKLSVRRGSMQHADGHGAGTRTGILAREMTVRQSPRKFTAATGCALLRPVAPRCARCANRSGKTLPPAQLIDVNRTSSLAFACPLNTTFSYHTLP